MLNTQDFAATQKANFETLMGMTTKVFEGVEQFAALNMQVVKASLDEATENGRAALSAKDPQAFFALQASLLQPSAEKATAYGHQVAGIVAGIKADFDKVTGRQAAAAQSAFNDLIETASKNAPAGSDNGMAMFKSAMVNATSAFESLQKAGRQAAETAEANYTAVTSQITKATTSARAKRG